jgi:hypothetical protein
MCFDTELSGAPERIGHRCWMMISEDLRLFAGRAGADLRGLEIALPESAAPATGPHHIGATADPRLVLVDAGAQVERARSASTGA